MARARKRHVQLEMREHHPDGRRKNRPVAGRPRKQGRASEPHQKRERFNKLRVVHVTLSLVNRFGTLRKRDTYFALRRATQAVVERDDFRVVHVSPEDDHIHLIVEADNHVALWHGVQAFQISAAQRFNRALTLRTGVKRRGKVFRDRYHARFVTSPTQARHTINYVLNNWRRHHHDERHREMRRWDIDYMSSAISFNGWKELERPGFRYQHEIDPSQRLCVSRPQSWLLNVGWRRAGSISMFSIPTYFDAAR